MIYFFQLFLLKLFLSGFVMRKKGQIVVVDFGAQYAHLIARRVRQLGVYSEIVLPEEPIEELQDCKGIILSGGPCSVYEEDAPKVDAKLFELGKPVLGLCYGQQLMAQALGGKVALGCVREYGTAELKVVRGEGVFAGLKGKETVWMSHGDKVEEIPQGFEAIGKTSDCENAAIADFSRKFFGLQFHPEVTHTPSGMKILENFVFKVCGCEKDWSIERFLGEKVKEIVEQVGERKVFLLASGGVDSTVALALLNKALGKEKVYSLHVDTGFMRKDESKKVKQALKGIGVSSFHVVDASEDFFKDLEGKFEPEEKRKIIGGKFIEVQRRELEKLGLNEEEWVLGQGTIYPDTIETAETKHAAKIKTHHNRVPIIKAMIEAGKVLEPISQLYKDEVRELGEKLGLPHGMVWRHPFPGPGLAIRCLCSDGKNGMVDAGLDKRLNAAVEKFGFKARALPIKSVGVQGDARTYAHPALLEGKLDWKALERASTALTNSFPEANRCVYAVKPNVIESVELEEAYLTEERIKVLQEADDIVMEEIAKQGLMEEIWQFPTILLPLKVNEGEVVVLRPVLSKEAMTAKFYPMEKGVLEEIAEKVLALDGIGAVLYDVTHKPPGTIEWE
jgi:GMP synthase (glutamine-hydrolysing)